MTGGLKYCNSCGVRLTAGAEDSGRPAGKMLVGVLSALSVIVITGIGVFIPLLIILLEKSVKPEIVVMISFAYLATIFGISFSLVRQASKLIDARLRGAEGFSAPEHREPARLSPLTTAQLEESRIPIGSVTDHTTRTLDKISLTRN